MDVKLLCEAEVASSCAGLVWIMFHLMRGS